MNFDFSPEENAFREEVRQFIADNYPKHLTESRRAEFTKEDFLSWHPFSHGRCVATFASLVFVSCCHVRSNKFVY